jgi:PKD repeat protein
VERVTRMKKCFVAFIGILFSIVVLAGLPLAFAAGSTVITEPESSGPDFTEIERVREFSGLMISRPLQPKALANRGLNNTEIEALRELARDEILKYDILEYVPQTDEYIFFIPAGSNENLVADRLMATGLYQYIEPDWIVFPVVIPNDPYFDDQWHHQSNRMQSTDGWDIHTGDPSVAVGICDTGVLTTHNDLQLHRLEGYNAVDREWESSGGDIDPVHSHGTWSTGCAAANGDNGTGVAGVGWDLSHRMLRVSNLSSGDAYLSDLQHAARISVENGDRVANVSYSGCDNSSNLTTATYIKSIGGLLTWSAGNDERYLTFGDRDDDDLLVVGATNEDDDSAWFSAWGPFVDLVAPGVNVLTTHDSNNNSYAWVGGTSFSAPLTAGLCALIWSADSTLTPDAVEDFLKQGTDDLGSGGVDNVFGYGRINVYGSMSLVAVSAPVADFSGSPTSGTSPLEVDFTDLSSGAITSWSWTFGDGGTSFMQNPSHTYTDTGYFDVTLTVTGPGGSDGETKTNYIHVTERSPDIDDGSFLQHHVIP